MPDITTAKEAVKESLLGAETAGEEQLSAQSKATFEKNARRDEKSGELFMGEEEFINAVAPKGEDYVSCVIFLSLCSEL
jgi:solute carrier family 25 aspartate/glutamate transporter 12/13